jgi:ribosomal protein L11 methyltransferase
MFDENAARVYTLTLACTRAEAEVLTGDIPELSLLEPAPVIVAREPEDSAADPSPNDPWEIIAYFDGPPDPAVTALIQSFLPSAKGKIAKIAALAEQDWVTISQHGLAPVQAGRFYVHTDAHRGTAPIGSTAFEIPASRAFGTGGHQTTAGCLAMLDAMARAGVAPRTMADIGTGTGLLAFAALKLWPFASAVATDIDPVSVDVVAENAVRNAIPMGVFPGQVSLAVANGTDHPLIRATAPFDLVIANILAGPLIDLAPSLSEIIAPGGHLILAGLLDTQQEAIIRAYRRCNMLVLSRLSFDAAGEWPVLCLRKRPRYSWARPRRNTGRSRQPAGDFGSW